MAKFGQAAILWTSTEDANTGRVFLLDQPLVEVTPRHTQTVYRRESLDKSAVETYTVGNGAYEFTGAIRFSADPDGLVEMLKAGSQGKTLTYIPNLNDPALRNSVILMDPMSPTQAQLDAQRGGYGEHQVSVRFRKTDESPFTGQARGTDVIFAYRAGGSLKHGVSTGTFARVTSTSAPASYASISTGDYGYGTISTAATNKARVSWMANPTSVGPRTFPVLLLEPARQNKITRSEGLNATGTWAKLNSPTVSTTQADPKGGTAGSLISDNSSANQAYIQATVTLVSTFAVVSGFFKAGTTRAASGSRLDLGSTSVAARIRATITWSSGIPSVTYANGVAAGSLERWRNGWYRIAARTTAAISSGSHEVNIVPSVTATQRGNLYAFGVQVEQ